VCRIISSSSRILYAFQELIRFTFIAFSGNSPIGIAALYRHGEGTDVGELLQVWVSPEYRSHGVAIDIINTVFQWAGENGFRTIVATIAKGNAKALRFYQKYGFKLANEASLAGSGDSVVLMKKVKVEQIHTLDELRSH
jgi:RimJ/RimL family protein N-acetyltransferase